MERKHFKGIMPAIFSVYDQDMNVLKGTVKKMVEYQLAGGVTGFYVGGNTGECAVLPAKTRKQMLEAVVEANEGRGDIVAHIGAGHFDETMELVKHANEIGVDAIASLPPALMGYYDMNQTLDYYRALAENSKAPVMAYITGVLQGSPVEFAQRVQEIPNVTSIKLTVPDYFAFGRVLDVSKGKLDILNGPDETMLCALALGADGAVGTTYNFIPKHAVSIYNDFLAGNIESAREKQLKTTCLIPHLLGKGLGYWKAVMETMGYDMGITVFPGTTYNSKEEIKALEAKLKSLGFYDMI